MTRTAFDAAMKMAGTVRWYEWVGQTMNGKVIRAQSRTMMRSPMHPLAVTGQFVRALEQK